MVHAGVECEGALFVNRWDFYETLNITPGFWSSLLCASSNGGAQLRRICDALIPHMDVLGVQLLFLKKFTALVNERSRGLSMEST